MGSVARILGLLGQPGNGSGCLQTNSSQELADIYRKAKQTFDPVEKTLKVENVAWTYDDRGNWEQVKKMHKWHQSEGAAGWCDGTRFTWGFQAPLVTIFRSRGHQKFGRIDDVGEVRKNSNLRRSCVVLLIKSAKIANGIKEEDRWRTEGS